MESLFPGKDALFQFTCLSAKDKTGAVTFKTAMKLRHADERYLRIAKIEDKSGRMKRQSTVNLKNRRR